MRVDELFSLGMPTCSFEFFPPKDDGGFDQLFKTIDRLRPLQPSYVSVTYGAGGSTRRKTVELAGRIQNESGLRVMAHLTCVNHTHEETADVVNELYGHGIRNLLALRGDPPGGTGMFTPTPGGFNNSGELVAFLRGNYPDVSIGVSGYPEGHPQCLNRTRDLEHLRQKIENGGNFIVTQLFFDNDDFYRWRDQARAMGIDAPIIAGIMPILNVAQIKRFVTMCGAKIPHPLLLKIEAVEQDADAVYEVGVEHATRQCLDLLANGVSGIHFYTLNRSRATADICQTLQGKFAVI
ncbi:MAG: methylenetetrahydrofolate reductase [NAD(P)H] [Capsulimonadales bacterium]|nr:methylenetetrahydrofolate reductase [NAD(P)H] [Capsulimonadales bacterium]